MEEGRIFNESSNIDGTHQDMHKAYVRDTLPRQALTPLGGQARYLQLSL
jgi:hypothetical protein